MPWRSSNGSACRTNGTTYSRLIASLKKSGIELDRKALAEMAVNDGGAFTQLVGLVGKAG